MSEEEPGDEPDLFEFPSVESNGGRNGRELLHVNVVTSYVQNVRNSAKRGTAKDRITDRGLRWVVDGIEQFRQESGHHHAHRSCFLVALKSRFATPAHDTVRFLTTIMVVLVPYVWEAANVDDSFDMVLDVILICGMVILTMDVIVSWLFQPRYRFSFHFFLSALGTLAVLAHLSVFSSPKALTDAATALTLGRFFNATRLIKYSYGKRLTRFARLMKLLRVHSFIQTITTATIWTIVVIVAVFALVSTTAERSTWPSLMAEVLADFSSDSCATSASLSYPDEACYSLEDAVMDWFSTSQRVMNASASVIYATVNNVTYINPFVMQEHSAVSAAEGSLLSVDALSPSRSRNAVLVQAEGLNVVELLVDFTTKARAVAMQSILVVTVIVVAILWLGLQVNDITQSAAITPLLALLRALDSAFPGTFCGAADGYDSTGLRTLSRRKQVSIVEHLFSVVVIRAVKRVVVGCCRCRTSFKISF